MNRIEAPAGFTRLVVLGLAVTTLATIWSFPNQSIDGPRENHLSVLGLLLPESTWSTGWLSVVAVVVFLVGIVAWTVSRWATAGAILAIGGLAVLGSIRVENELYARHQLFVPFTVLAVLAGATALGRGRLAFEGWIWTAVAVAVGWSYTTAGFEKLQASGPAWADGTSLRVWLAAFAPDDSLGAWLVQTPWAATVAQSTALVLEVTAVVGLSVRSTRTLSAFGLLTMHLVTESMLGLGFFGNEFVLLALSATPFLAVPSAVTKSTLSEAETTVG